MKSRAAVLNAVGLPEPYADSRPLSVEEVELQDPKSGEVLIEIKAAGLCHSDLSAINGDRPRRVPLVLGHEAAGVVKQIGPGVDKVEVGDHVVLVFVPSCGSCPCCVEGRPALCEPGNAANGRGELLAGGSRLSLNGQPLNHHVGISAFSQHAVVSARSVVPIDRDVPFDHAALFGCAVLTGVGAVFNTAKVHPGSSVAVVGLGGVGFSSLLGAVASGASRIVAVDILDSKLDFARELGATDVFNATDSDCVDQIREATSGGTDYVFEMAGSVPALELAYGITRRGGVTVTAGLAHPDKVIAIQQAGLVAEERTLKGSYIGSCVPMRDVPRMINMYKYGRLPVHKLLDGKLKLEEINEGFDRLAKGQSVRQLIIF